MKIRVIYNKILWSLGIREILPSYFIRKVEIRDSGEKLVFVNESERVRKTVSDKIKKAEKFLPEGYSFFVAEGYRSPKRQQDMWDAEFDDVKKQNPNLDNDEIERLTSLRIARPGTNSGAHQTGGAIDITIIDENGQKLNMGTEIVEFNKKTNMNSNLLTEEEKDNRLMLAKALSQVGFNNYPAEWWHWSYGDKMWAAYKKQPFAIYGPVEEN